MVLAARSKACYRCYQNGDNLTANTVPEGLEHKTLLRVYAEDPLESIVSAVGERGRCYWPIRTFTEINVALVAGSDWPEEKFFAPALR